MASSTMRTPEGSRAIPFLVLTLLLVLLFGFAGCGDERGGEVDAVIARSETPTPTPTETVVDFPTRTPTPTVIRTPGSNETPDLVTAGARLFFQETFDGNGRTCGTCHPPAGNFTLTPELIATLPDDDPLFVAEFNPALAELENPDLMRSRALILENVDGFDQPPVFRGVPHIFNQTFTAPFGWSGSTLSLRDFATAAVIQHFPRSLNRAVLSRQLGTDAAGRGGVLYEPRVQLLAGRVVQRRHPAERG